MQRLWLTMRTWSSRVRSRCWRWSRDGVRDWPRRIIDGLPFWKPGHCLRAYEGERDRLQCPPELRSDSSV